eukprot:9965297-Karenia_brevis.AAC.1
MGDVEWDLPCQEGAWGRPWLLMVGSAHLHYLADLGLQSSDLQYVHLKRPEHDLGPLLHHTMKRMPLHDDVSHTEK